MDIYITKKHHGILIEHFDPATDERKTILYCDYTERQALRVHQKKFNLERKHLNKIYL